MISVDSLFSWGAGPAGFLGSSSPSFSSPAPLFLGQLPPPTMGEAWPVLLTLVAIGGVALMIKMLFPARKPPIEAEYATKAEVKAMIQEVIRDLKEDRATLEARLAKIETEMREEFRQHRIDASARHSGLHHRIDDIAKELSGLIEVNSLVLKHAKISLGTN